MAQQPRRCTVKEANFFILGLPRSRTAWLANFMTYGASFCYHEGLNGCRSIAEYKDKLGYNKGDSSTGSAFLDLHKHFPGTKKVIIESDIERSIEYSKKHFGVSNEEGLLHLQSKLYQLDGYTVKFDDIDDNLQDIWEYLSDEPYDSDRCKLLIDMNIQIKTPYNIDVDACQEMSHEFT